MKSGVNSFPRGKTRSKISGGTQECQREIESFLCQGPESKGRLKELLPLIFDSHGVWTLEGQATVLRACSLKPIHQKTPFHHVTFAIQPDPRPASGTSRPS